MTDIKQMLKDIRREVEYTRALTGISAFDTRVMEAMQKVPRHKFVLPGERRQAYYNGPLPIGHGQTISQPYIVALMTDILEPETDDVILEVGTGSGYQAAVLSQLVSQVYTLEIIEPLYERSASLLRQLGYLNIECHKGNGYLGLPQHAPYDGIIVTAAAPDIPQALVDQLKVGARLVIPIGQPHYHQELMLLEKRESGEIVRRDVLGVAFVPMTGRPQNQE